MPLQRRVPKFGFKNANRKEYKAINIDVLEKLATDKKLDAIDTETIVKAGLASKKDLIKILGNGSLSKKLNVKAHAFSKKAVEIIESLQGTAEKIS
jgi:large subunit ribosomal protein L15